jgi:hypothetical protein
MATEIRGTFVEYLTEASKTILARTDKHETGRMGGPSSNDRYEGRYFGSMASGSLLTSSAVMLS